MTFFFHYTRRPIIIVTVIVSKEERERERSITHQLLICVTTIPIPISNQYISTLVLTTTLLLNKLDDL